MSKSKTKPQWMRPQDVQTFFTSDVKEMHGKYLPKNVLKTWTEDFVDEDTGELVSIERSQVLIGRGEITRDKLQEIAFHIQSGDIKEVEVCEQDIQEMTLFTPAYMTNYMVEIPITSSGGVTKNHFLVRAQTIPQAIIIAAEFGQMHRGFNGMIKPTRVNILDAFIVPDDHKCIPEAERTPAYMLKDYFKVQVRTEYIDGGGKPKTYDTNQIINTNIFKTKKIMNNIVITLDTINSLTPTQVVRNESVRLKFIDVYDTIWGEGTGEPAYEREANYFNSQIRDKEELRKCTSFSIFTSFIDLAVCGLSLEPGSRALCYLIPRSYKTSAKDGKDLWEKRAKLTISGYGELVLRARAGQIRHADNPVLVYEGDTFSFSDVDGRKTVNYTCNLPHTSDHIIAAYLRITRTDGTQDFSVMLEEDWNRLAEYSKKNNSYYDKSGQKVEKVNELYRSSNGSIDPGFLCAKLIKHAFKTYPKVRIGKAVLESEEKAAAEVDIENFYNVDGAPGNAPDAGNAPADNTSAQDGAPVPATDHNDDTF